jgi:hypothetical protein
MLDQVLRFVYLPDHMVVDPKAKLPAAYLARVQTSLECLSQMCRDHNCRTLVRNSSLPHLLYSNLAIANRYLHALVMLRYVMSYLDNMHLLSFACNT